MSDHAGQMDRMYRLQRHLYDATRKYYLLGRDAVIDTLDPPAGGHVLEVGCGTGRNLIAAARRWPQARFYGLDISREMLATAASAVARAGLGDRVVLAQGDAAAFDPQALFGVPAFDRVVQSYTLSMIPDWQGAVRAAAGVLAPGGRLMVVDFGQQEALPGVWRRAINGWLARWHVTPRADLPAVIDSLAGRPGWSGGVTPRYRGYAWQGELERLVTAA